MGAGPSTCFMPNVFRSRWRRLSPAQAAGIRCVPSGSCAGTESQKRKQRPSLERECRVCSEPHTALASSELIFYIQRVHSTGVPTYRSGADQNLPIYQAIVLAIVQGLGEFIPISSSGHLIIVRRLLGWNELSPAHELSFDVALHFGTLLSVLFYFRRTWLQMISAAFGGKVVRFSEAGSSDVNLTAEEQKEERMLLWFMAIATIPGAIAGKLLEHSAEDYFREHIFLIAGALIVVALL